MERKSQVQNKKIEEPIDVISLSIANKRKKKIYTLGAMVAILVVFFTAYMLVLPALTMEKSATCGKEEHYHEESCYASDDVDFTTPICGIEEHTHTSACYRDVRSENDVVLSTDDGTITSMVISYMCPNADPEMTDFEEISDGIVLHGNDLLKLDVEYGNVSISDLKKSDYKVYFPLPDWIEEITDAPVVDMYDQNYNVIGEVTVQNGYLVGTYDKTWIDNQTTASQVNGTLLMELEFSIANVSSDKLTIGNITINVDYDRNSWASKYASISLQKSNATYIEQDDDYDLLEYTLTVTTGESGMDNVKVVDVLTVDDTSTSGTENVTDYVKEVVGVTENETEILNDTNGLSETSTLELYNNGKISYDFKNLVWNIGDMKPNETRTLTYQVMLKKEVTGLGHKNALRFHNSATVYSNDIDRDTQSTNFDAKAGTYVDKGKISVELDSDGIGGTITYFIKVSANSDNTYTMDNLKIYDFFGDWYTSTLTAQEVTINKDSFRLYEGNATTQARIDALTSDGKELPFDENNLTIEEENGNFKSFTVYMGDFAPGDEITLVYTATIHDVLFLNNNGSFTLGNRATLYEDDTKNTITPSPNVGQINAYLTYDTISYSTWDKKYTGVRADTSQEINMNSNVYKLSGSTISKVDDVNSFMISGDDYRYQVVVNQYGDLDVNSATLTDTLNNYMKYTGYLRVDAYDTLKSKDLSSIDFSNIGEDIERTAWLEVDDLTTFTFKPSDLGFSGNYAYVLTYYAEVDYDGSDLYISTTNSFNMSGSIYGTGGTYILAGSFITVTTQAITSSVCASEKYAWYYDYPKTDDTDDWSLGSLYWYISVTGTEIPENTLFKDELADSNHKLVNPASLVGVYIVDKNASFSSVDDLTGDDVEVLDSSQYELTWSDDGTNVSIKFPDNIIIMDDKEVRIVIKTAPLNKASYGNYQKYSNNLWQQMDGQSIQQVGNTIVQTVETKKTSSKSLADKVAIYDGTTCYNTDGTLQFHGGEYKNYDYYNENGEKVCRLPEPGAYLEYEIDTCLNGNLTGDVILSDIIPEGLEVTFLRNEWYHGGDPIPTADNVEIEEIEEDIKYNENTKWTRYEEPNKPYSNATSDYCIYYFNSETRELRWKIANAKATSGGIIDFQLVCQIVDEEVLLGLKTGNYTNGLTVYQNDRIVDTAQTNTVEVSLNSLSKSVVSDEANGNLLPFKIVVNDAGTNLLENSDTITIVDELGSSLNLDIDSISVKDKDNNEIEDFTVALTKTDNKTYLYLTVPDDKKLIITYDTRINGINGETVSIENIAHWEGYEPSQNSEVTESRKLNISGTGGVTGHASLKLTKRDSQDIMSTLSDATYTMQEATLNDDGTYTLVGDVHTATTDENGEIYFSTGSDNWMKYDTIYCLTETSAPLGYAISSPEYILLASNDNTNEYPSEIEVQRYSAQYDFEALDKPSSMDYELPTTGGIGDYSLQILGVSFIAIATIGFVTKRKSKKSKA